LHSPAFRLSQHNRSPFFPNAVGVVDATHQRIQKPFKHQSRFYRKDVGYHSLVTQCVVDWDGAPAHVCTRVPGRFHDVRTYRESGVENVLGPNDVLLGDCGYRKGARVVTPFTRPQAAHSAFRRAFSRVLRQYRVLVEITFRYIKRFRVLSHTWRHPHRLYYYVVSAVYGIVAWQIRRWGPLFNINHIEPALVSDSESSDSDESSSSGGSDDDA
jgi:hypothetical protein